MFHDWTPADFGVFFLAAATFLGTVTTLALQIIKAVKENTAVTVANTLDRAAKTAMTSEQLGTIQTLVTDIHKGTGDGAVQPSVTVNIPPPAATTGRPPTT